MFVDKAGDRSDSSASWTRRWSAYLADPKKQKIIGFAAAAFLLVGLGVLYWAANRTFRPAVTGPATAKIANQLPGLGSLGDGQNQNQNQILAQAEKLYFGDFYQASGDDLPVSASGVGLPTNVKELAANYYETNRVINLNKSFAEINQNGLAVLDNSLSANDFYGVYHELNQKNLAYLVTNDFLLYYYQNSLKNIFKRLEGDVFYREFWNVNKAMFDLADARYRERYDKIGVLNDPILEGSRLEAVYFGVMLEILKAKPDQTLSGAKNSVKTEDDYKNFFSDQEAATYSFRVPAYLADTVNQEAALIERGSRNGPQTHSPAFLYERDYREFTAPKEYRGNAKLNNFYLATVWARSLWPLYYKSDFCPDCLLDKEDWIVNQAAANLLARDLASHQDLKNSWAKIYKVLSFFGSLRQSLIYLDYNQVFINLFGDQESTAAKDWLAQNVHQTTAPFLTVENVFDSANADRERQLAELQTTLAKIGFDPAQGGWDLTAADGRAAAGMRLLMPEFDPTGYFNRQLLYDKVGPRLSGPARAGDPGALTACSGAQQTVNRCRPFGLDIINAVFDEPIKSDYFSRNTDYQFYGNQAPLLRQYFNQLNQRDWHANLYWTSLDLSRQLLNHQRLNNWPLTQTAAWTDLNLNTAAGALLNSRLPVELMSASLKKDAVSSTADSLVKYNYIQPNLRLINELLADSRMVFDVFVGLDLVRNNDNDFTRLIGDLQGVKDLMNKELSGQEFYYQDWNFLNELTTRYYVTDSGLGVIKSVFPAPDGRQVKTLVQSLNGVKLAVMAVHHQGRDLLVVGPIFNFQERGE